MGIYTVLRAGGSARELPLPCYVTARCRLLRIVGDPPHADSIFKGWPTLVEARTYARWEEAIQIVDENVHIRLVEQRKDKDRRNFEQVFRALDQMGCVAEV